MIGAQLRVPRSRQWTHRDNLTATQGPLFLRRHKTFIGSARQRIYLFFLQLFSRAGARFQFLFLGAARARGRTPGPPLGDLSTMLQPFRSNVGRQETDYATNFSRPANFQANLSISLPSSELRVSMQPSAYLSYSSG